MGQGCVVRLPKCPERVFHETPGGVINCVNLVYTTANKFDPDTLVVKVDGNVKTPILDYTIAANNQGFTFIVDPSDGNRLNSPLRPTEELRVDYTPLNTGCIVEL